MTSYFKKLRNQIRCSERSQIFVGFPASLSCSLLFADAVSAFLLTWCTDAHNLGEEKESMGGNYPCNEGISRLLHGAVSQSKTQRNVCPGWFFLLLGVRWFLSLHDCINNSSLSGRVWWDEQGPEVSGGHPSLSQGLQDQQTFLPAQL